MEVLLAACLLAWAAGAQSEQAKLGVSPAQRALIREQVRHDKAVRRIAEEHGTTPRNPAPGVSTWKEPPAAAAPVTIPEAFRAGYRGHTPVARVATPLGRHAGDWTAKGVYWVKDTGRSAVKQFRKSRRVAGEPDPAPVLIPMPPNRPPVAVPPMPADPPTVGSGSGSGSGSGADKGVTLAKPEAAPGPEGSVKPPEGAAEPAAGGASTTGAPTSPTGPEKTADGPASVPAPRSPEPAGTGGVKATVDVKNGVGRMAAEVSYESVMDESDELSLMCDDDVKVYGRIRQRCEREIGRADDLIAALDSIGAGSGVIAWVVRCKDQYQAMNGQLDDLERNTLTQAEAVARAKGLLEAGQGLYADIAADMESVAERDFYTGDAVDGEDTSAHSETYETKGA